MLEEIIAMSVEHHGMKNMRQKQSKQSAKTNFGLALGDFNFCLNKALNNLVS